MRTGIATVPLDYGKCPRWLFERMRKLARGIIVAVTEELGPDEVLKRFSDPVWFQSLGCVMGFDWNSSGLTTTTLGATKAALFDIQDRLGVFICGGKGKTSRGTPEELLAYGISRGFSFAPDLIYASKMAAKTDSSLVQDGYQIYHHNILFSKSGKWTVVQQGMNEQNSTARRYHWFSPTLKKIEEKTDFVEEPHSGIISGAKVKPLNLTAKESDENREVSVGLVKEEPKRFLKDLSLIQTKKSKNLTTVKLYDKEFHWHPVVEEKFDLKRLEKTIFLAKEQNPKDFERFLSLKGIGPRTVRALSLVSEIIHGAKPSYEDPARYSFAHGGKDGTPYFPKPEEMDKTIKLLERGIQKSQISLNEKSKAHQRLINSF
jgi:hypothetical protein